MMTKMKIFSPFDTGLYFVAVLLSNRFYRHFPLGIPLDDVHNCYYYHAQFDGSVGVADYDFDMIDFDMLAVMIMTMRATHCF